MINERAPFGRLDQMLCRRERKCLVEEFVTAGPRERLHQRGMGGNSWLNVFFFFPSDIVSTMLLASILQKAEGHPSADPRERVSAIFRWWLCLLCGLGGVPGVCAPGGPPLSFRVLVCLAWGWGLARGGVAVVWALVVGLWVVLSVCWFLLLWRSGVCAWVWVVVCLWRVPLWSAVPFCSRPGFLVRRFPVALSGRLLTSAVLWSESKTFQFS